MPSVFETAPTTAVTPITFVTKATWDAIVTSIGSGVIGAVPAAVIPDVGAQTPTDMPTFMSALFSGPIK
ncbi:MAG: hypothetical protein ACK463_32090, partial [Bradyrhizobium sp.]